MKNYILDSSVVAKWLLNESDSVKAQRLIDTDHHFRAPDLIMPELASILLKRMVRKEMTAEECDELLQQFLDKYLDIRIRVIPSRLLAERALHIARTEQQSTYDSLYLALAVQARCQLITADERFLKSIRNKQLKERVISLHDPALGLDA